MSSKTVDNRVVEMEFDNANFEKNANQSIGTLQKLRQALKLDGASKSLNDVDSAASKLDFQKLIAAADTITSRFSTFGIMGTEAIKRVTNSVMDLTGRLTSFITSGITSGGLSRAFNLENANFQLQGLLKSDEKVAEVMKDVSASVDGTAYGMDAAAKAASMLAASGIQASSAGGTMLTSLRAITGVAAMTNSEYEGVAQIFTTVAGQGRLMGDQLLQLSSRGLNAAATLADYLNKVSDDAHYTEADIRELVSDGQISFAMFADAMDDAFGEHAFKANETFSGSMSNIRSALARIGADFVAPLIVQNGKLVELFNNVRLKINEIRKSTTPFATALAGAFNKAFGQISDYISKVNLRPLASMFTSLTDKVTSFNRTLDLSPMFTIAENLGGIVTNVARPISQALSSIGAAFKDVFPTSFVDVLVNVTSKFKNLTDGLSLNIPQMQAIRGIFQGLFTVLKSVGEVLMMVVKPAFEFLGSHLPAIGSKVLEFAGYLGNCIYRFHEWVDANNLVTRAIEGVQNAIAFIKGKISGWIQEFKELPVVQNLIQGVSEAFTGSLGPIKEILSETTQKVGEFISKVFETRSISLEDVKGLLNTLKETATNVFSTLGEHFSQLRDKLSWIPESFSQMVNRVIDIIEPWKDRVINAFNAVKDFLTQHVNPGAFMAAGFGLAIFKLLDKLVDWSNLLPGLVGSIKGAVKGLSTSLSKIMKGMAFSKYADGIKKIAEAIAILAGSLIALSFVDPEKLKNAGIALGAVALGLGLLAGGMGLLEKYLGSGASKFDLSGMAKNVLAMSISMIILIKALKNIEELDETTVWNNLKVMGALVTGLVAAAVVLDRATKGSKSSALSMVAIAVALNGMVKALRSIAELNLDDNLFESLSALTVIVALLDTIQLSSRGVGAGAGFSMILAVASILLVIEAVKKLADVNPSDLTKGVAVIAAIGAVLDGILLFSGLATHLGGGGIGGNAGLTMIAAAGAILILGHSVERLGNLDLAVLEKGVKAVALLGAVMDAIILVTALAGPNAAKAGVTLLAFSAACAILSGVVYILGTMDEETVNQGLKAIAGLGAIMSLIVASTGLAGEAKATLIIITVAIGIMAGAIAMLSLLDPTGVTIAAAAMSAVMGMFALIVASTAIAKKANSTIALVGLVVAELGGILALLAGFAPENVLGAAEGLSLVMLALSASLLIISNAKDVSGKALLSLAAMGLVLLEVGVVLGILGALGIEPSIETVTALSIMIVSLSAALALLEVAGLAAGAAMAGVEALILLITSVGVLMGIIGGLATKFPALEEFLDKGITILIKIGEGLGSFFGSIISGFFQQALGFLPDLGTKLSLFMDNVQGFVAGAKNIDSSIVESVAALSAAILMISGAELIHNIMSFLGGGIDFEKFGTQIVALGKALVKFSDIVQGIDANAITAAANAGKLMAELQAMLPAEGGWLQKFLGTKLSLGDFGDRVTEFGKGLKQFSDSVKDIDSEAVTAAANAGKLMAEIQNMLPETGGKLQEFLGEKLDLGEFGKRITEFAKAMGDASNALMENPVDSAALESAANAGKLFAELQNSLPETGGKLQEFLGETQNLGDFGDSIVTFCMAMGRASATLVEHPIEESAIESAVKMGELFSALENSLAKKTGSLEKFFFGENQQLDSFAKNIEILGVGIQSFNASVSGVNTGQMRLVISVVSSLAEVEKELVDVNSMKMETFGVNLKNFAANFEVAAGYFKSVSFTAISASVDSIRELLDLLREMSDVNFDVAQSFVNAMKTMGQTGVDDFCNAFDNAGSRAYNSLATFIQRAMDGVNSKQPAFVTLVQSNFDQIVTIIDGFQPKFLTSGTQLMTQLIAGYQAMVVPFTTLMMTTMLNVYKDITAFEPRYKEAGSNLMTQLMSGFKSKETFFITQLKNMMTEALKQVTDKNRDFDVQGQNLMIKLSGGIKSKESDVTTGAIKPIMESSLSVIRGYHSSFTDAGYYLIQGIANGISNAAWIAREAAANAAAQANQAAREKLKIHSPSKVGIETGEYYGEGLAIGVENKTDRAAEAGATVATALNESVVDTLEDSTVDISTAVSYSIDEVAQANVPASKVTGTDIGEAFTAGIEDGTSSASVVLTDSTLGAITFAESKASPEAVAFGQKIIDSLSEGLEMASTDEEKSYARFLYGKVMDTFRSETAKVSLKETGKEAGDTVIEGAVDKINTSGVSDISTAVVGAGTAAVEEATPKFTDLGVLLIKSLEEGLEQASTEEEKSFARFLYGKVLDTYRDNGGDMAAIGYNFGTTMTGKVSEGIMNEAPVMGEAVGDAVTEAGQIGEAFAATAGENVGAKLGEGVAAGVETSKYQNFKVFGDSVTETGEIGEAFAATAGENVGEKLGEGVANGLSSIAVGETITTELGDKITNVGQIGEAFATTAGESIGEQLGEGISEGIKDSSVTETIEGVKEQTNDVFSTSGLEAFNNFIQGFGEKAGEVETKIQEIVTKSREALDEMIRMFGEKGKECTESFLTSFGDSLGKIDLGQLNGDAVSQAIGETLAAAIADATGKAAETTSGAMKSVGEKLGGFINEGLETSETNIQNRIVAIIDGVKAKLTESLASFREAGKQIANAISEGIQTEIQIGVGGKQLNQKSYSDGAKTNANTYNDTFTGIMAEKAGDVTSSIADPADAGMEAVKGTILEGMTFTISTMNFYTQQFEAAGTNIMAAFVNAMMQEFATLSDKLNERFAVMLTSMDNVKEEFKSIGQSYISNLIDGMSEAANAESGFVKAITTVIESTVKAGEGNTDQWIQIGKNIVYNMCQGVGLAQHRFYEAIGNILYAATKRTQSEVNQMQTIGVNMATAIADGLYTNIATVDTAIVALVDLVNEKLYPNSSLYFGYGATVTSSYLLGFNSNRTMIIVDVTSLVRTVMNILERSDGGPAGRKLGSTFVAAIRSYESEAYAAGKALAEAANKGLEENLKTASKIASLSNDAQPVITPTMDLTEVEKSAEAAQSLLNGLGSTSMGASASINSGQIGEAFYMNEPPIVNNYNYDMTQNNTSPKALSRVEIYRDTKNLFSQLKETTSVR